MIKKNRRKTLHVRVAPKELRSYVSRARRRRLSLSAWVRSTLEYPPRLRDEDEQRILRHIEQDLDTERQRVRTEERTAGAAQTIKALVDLGVIQHRWQPLMAEWVETSEQGFVALSIDGRCIYPPPEFDEGEKKK